MTKKALIVSYYWPPSGGSGVQRWMYFAKFLGENGIEPTVITINPKEAAYPAMDESLLKHTKDVRVMHTSGGFQVIQLYSKLKGGATAKQIPVGDFGSKKKTRFDKLAGYIRANWFIPDARVGWNKQVIPLAKKLLQEETFDFIITTGPPHSTHLVGLELKKLSSAKWIADFRDPWREVYYNNLFKRTKRADHLDKKLEMAVIESADLVLTIGPSMRDLLLRKLPNQPDKFAYVLNGYDESLFEKCEANRYKEFTLAHIGVWTAQQPYQEVVYALEQLIQQDSLRTIRFVLAGNVSEDILKALREIPQLIVDYRGKVTHAVAIQEMMNADVLLNCLALVGDSKILISGKLMEYLATGNTVIAIGNPEGDAAAIINQFEQAHVVVPGDVENLKKLIFEQLVNRNQLLEKTTTSSKYSRRQTTKALADLLKIL